MVSELKAKECKELIQSLGKIEDNKLPSTPAAPKLTSSSPNSLSISWEASNGYGFQVTEYRLQVGRNNFSQIIANEVVNGTNFTVNNIEPITTYELRVSACSVVGESPFGEAAQFQTKSPFFVESTLLSPEHQQILNEFFGVKDQRWRLLYKVISTSYS